MRRISLRALLGRTGVVGVLLALFSSGSAAAAGVSCPPPNGDAYSQAVLADSPIAYYRLDESGAPTMCDASSSANNGTYNAGGITYGVAGALASGDSAISANGTSGVVGQSGSDPSGLTGNHDFTLEAWFRNTESTPANHVLVDIGQPCSDMVSAGSCNGVTINNGSIAGLALYPDQNAQLGWGPTSGFGIDAQGSSVVWDPAAVGINLWDGNWHYLAVTVSYDASHNTDDITGYVDGQDLGAPNRDPYDSNQIYNVAAAPIALGQWATTGYFYPLVGGLDEVAVYPAALSAPRIAAHFAAASAHTLAVSTVGQGTVTSAPSGIDCGPGATSCSASYPDGTQVSLTETPSSGVTFAGWSGGGCSGSGTCVVTMNSNQTVTATFNTTTPPTSTPPAQEALSVSLAGTGSGTVTGSSISCPGTCSASYPQGSQVTLTAAPNFGSTFAGWSGGGCAGTGTCTVSMSTSRTLTAVFDSAQFASPSSSVTIIPRTTVQLPSGNRGLVVNTQGACELSLSEAPTPLAAIAAGHRRKRHLGREGLIKPVSVTVSNAGRHVLPLVPTRKEITLWRRHHKHRRGAHPAAAGPLDPLRVRCVPVSFGSSGTPPPPPVIANSSSVSPTPPPGFTSFLGGLDLDSYCRSIGFSHSQLDSPIVAPNALNDWVCVSSAGQQQSLSLQAACTFQYPGFNVLLVGNSNNGYSGQCWAKGTPTGPGTTTTTKVPPPPPPPPPLSGCWHGSNNAGSISVCVSHGKVTSLSASVNKVPTNSRCPASASIPQPVPLGAGGGFSWDFPAQGFSGEGQLTATGGQAGVGIASCTASDFFALKH